MQQKTRLVCLWFHKSKSIVTVQRRFRLEYRNCQSPSKNSIKRWYEQLRSESLPHSFKNPIKRWYEQLRSESLPHSFKNPIKRWYEQFKGTGNVLHNHRSRTKFLNE
ncbi:hypothetical protein AVEN_95552-1 [Araneus ventricosus]|uniref:DUF4817 domain-containing protein n=1 Tax=Araneus ventricosus TaxID=182803 RepID=A0A4Y2HBB6_ARAVE|nr:hypothetical protein AVEN_95552-1 [Araneus ventricosus]